MIKLHPLYITISNEKDMASLWIVPVYNGRPVQLKAVVVNIDQDTVYCYILQYECCNSWFCGKVSEEMIIKEILPLF